MPHIPSYDDLLATVSLKIKEATIEAHLKEVSEQKSHNRTAVINALIEEVQASLNAYHVAIKGQFQDSNSPKSTHNIKYWPSNAFTPDIVEGVAARVEKYFEIHNLNPQPSLIERAWQWFTTKL